ncbi:amidohydrolase family protein [Hydrogenimonas sp.]
MVIKNAKIVTPEGVVEGDLRIENGVIAQIGSDLDGENVKDAAGRYLLPALVDIGVGVLDGRLRGGTLQKLAKKAYRNGFGTVVVSSLSLPRIDNEITLEFAKSQAELCPEAEILPLLSGVREEGGLSDCSILLKEGAVGIEFESHIDGNLIRRLMEYAGMHGVRLFCRANDPALQGDGVMHEGEVSSRLGLSGIPPVGESSQVARIGEFARTYEVETVVLGASTPETVEICNENPWLKVQVSIHHLLLNDTVCENYETAGKIFPPIRDEARRRALVESFENGEIDMLTSLHSPVSDTAKDAVFAEAAYGIDGLTNFLPSLYTRFVATGSIDFPSLAKMTAASSAEAIGMEGRRGKIEVGYEADLILFDPHVEISSMGEKTPYTDDTLYGAIEKITEG